jgi:para-aminobenzoate synthetase / 4-amino-4-deoxychorismate lyase
MAAVPGAWRPDPRQGVFETLLVIDGRLVELEPHLGRLQASLKELFPDRSAPDPRGKLEEHVLDVSLAAVRLAVVPTGTGDLRVEIHLREALGAFVSLSGTKAPRPVALRTFGLAGGLGVHKWADRSLLDEAQKRLPVETLPLIIDTDGSVLEASRANIFAVRDGALFTPPLDGRILSGITRGRVLEIAVEGGHEMREESLSRSDLRDADEVFLTGSVRGIETAASLDGTTLAGAGPLAAALAEELRRTWLGAPVS